jgi:Transposase DDE domain
MHATQILRRALSSALEPMHGGRRKVLMRAVESLIDGRRLTLTDLSRSWPDAVFAHAPLKALDRLLSNHRLHGELDALHRAMAVWLMPEACPVIVVDWSDLKCDGRWCLLRAAVPVGGRTLTVCERIYPNAELNAPGTQRAFLGVLAQIVLAGKRPVIVSDAGFRSDWFRAVAARGWDYIGRVRNNTKVRQGRHAWRPCSTLFAGATGDAQALGCSNSREIDPSFQLQDGPHQSAEAAENESFSYSSPGSMLDGKYGLMWVSFRPAPTGPADSLQLPAHFLTA